MHLSRVFHVFRNTPLGRETTLGAAYVCRRTGGQLYLYRPTQPRFTLQLKDELVEVTLDGSYVADLSTVESHATALLEAEGVPLRWLAPSHMLASTMPVLAGDFDLMTCPRSLSDPPAGLAPGLLGTRVRRLVRAAPFPLLILTTPFVEWDTITVFFAGSAHAVRALTWARDLAAAAGAPCTVITHDEGNALERATTALEQNGWLEEVQPRWQVLTTGQFNDCLWEVPRTALVVAGAFGHSGIKARLLGSRTELLQSALPNPLLLVGPRAKIPE